MNRTLILLVAVLAASAAIRPGQGAGQASLVFTDITVIDATGAAPKRQMMVVIAGDTIARIESHRKDRVPKAVRVIDAHGKFVIPGKTADLVFLDADPLLDIRNTQRIGGVAIGGRYFPRAELDGMMASVEAIARSSQKGFR